MIQEVLKNKKCVRTLMLVMLALSAISFLISFTAGYQVGQTSIKISVWGFAFSFLFVTFATACRILLPVNITKNIRSFPEFQVFVIVFPIWLFWILAFINSNKEALYTRLFMAGIVALTVTMVTCFCRIGIFIKKSMRTKDFVISIKQWLFNHWMEGVLLVALTIMMSSNLKAWIYNDSAIYYLMSKEHCSWSFVLSDLQTFYLSGHASFVYAVLLRIGDYLFPNNAVGMRLVNLVLSLVVTAQFYAIIEKKFSEKIGQLEKTLITAVFAFSPLFLGVSYCIGTDFPLLCFVIFLFYSMEYDLKIFKAFSVFAVCFAKESGILIVFGVYLGECIKELIRKREVKSFREKVIIFFSSSKIITYCSVLVFVISVLFSYNHWSRMLRGFFSGQTNTEDLPNRIIKWHYPIFRLRQFFLMNFFWVILVVCILALILWFVRRRKSDSSIKDINEGLNVINQLPYIFSGMVFVVSQMAWFTYVHYRYIQTWLFYYILLFAVAVFCVIRNKRIRIVLLTAVAGLFLFESYLTIDPVTNRVWRTVDIGDRSIATTRTYLYEGESTGYGYVEGTDEQIATLYLALGVEYNRDCLNIQRIMEEALSDINYDSSKLIVLDTFGGSLSNTARQLLGGTVKTSYYYDNNNGTVEFFTETYSPDNVQDKEFINLAKPDELGNLDDYTEVYYFKFPYNPYIDNDGILTIYASLYEFEVASNGWTMQVYRIK